MPIIPNFLDGGGGNGGIKLAPVTNIIVQPANEKVYIKWTDPNDIVVSGAGLAVWDGTILVRKAGSAPASRRDGAIILDSKTRNAYKDNWFCDSGLTNGVTYYYKLFPYTIDGAFTDDPADEFTATPATVAPGNVTNISLTAAGNGKLGISWTDPSETIVRNGIVVSTWDYTKVVVKTGSYASNPNDAGAVFTFTSTTRNAYQSTSLIATGLTNGTTYYVSFFPVSTDGAVNTSTANRKSGVANRMTIDVVPSQSGTLTYRGENQSPSWNNYDTAKMTISCTPQTNAGTYEASVTPNADYCWSDGTTGAKTIQWTIGKANPSAPLIKSSLGGDDIIYGIVLNSANPIKEYPIQRDGDGTIMVVSSNPSVVKVSIDGVTMRVESVNQTSGNATITVTVGEGTNYLAYTAGTTCDVEAQFIPTVLNDATWAQISEASLAGTASSYWDVGDTKMVVLSGTIGTKSVNTALFAFILGFDHNISRESNNKHSIHFGTFVDEQYDGQGVCIVDSSYGTTNGSGGKDISSFMFSMNHWGVSTTVDGDEMIAFATNLGGWKACDLRYDILGSTNVKPLGYPGIREVYAGYNPSNYDVGNSPLANTFLSALPKDLRVVMRPINKYTDNVGGKAGGNPTVSTDYLPLLSEFEVFGTISNANSSESSYQVQYEYYISGNSKKKYYSGASCNWWFRSPAKERDNEFLYYFKTVDRAVGGDSRYSYGIAPIFMV